jgi:hypothetical protein
VARFDPLPGQEIGLFEPSSLPMGVSQEQILPPAFYRMAPVKSRCFCLKAKPGSAKITLHASGPAETLHRFPLTSRLTAKLWLDAQKLNSSGAPLDWFGSRNSAVIVFLGLDKVGRSDYITGANLVNFEDY